MCVYIVLKDGAYFARFFRLVMDKQEKTELSCFQL
jgi:hypothetical protein